MMRKDKPTPPITAAGESYEFNQARFLEYQPVLLI